MIAPLGGTVRKGRAEVGDVLERGASVATVVARHDEHYITVTHGGEILEWLVEDGDPVAPGQPPPAADPPHRLLRLIPSRILRSFERGLPGMASIKEARGAAHTRILGVGGYRPSRIVTNEEVCTWIDSSDEWIQSRSGIVSRRWATPEETVVEMSVEAAGKALAAAGISADQLGAVLVATVSHLHQTPAVACLIGDRLGTKAAAWDIGGLRRVLLRRGAGFGHGQGRLGRVRARDRRGAALGPDRQARPRHRLHLRRRRRRRGDRAVGHPRHRPGGLGLGRREGRDGDLNQTYAWNEQPVAREDGTMPDAPYLRMEGQAVFRWASYEMAPVAQRALEAAGLTADDLEAKLQEPAHDPEPVDVLRLRFGRPDARYWRQSSDLQSAFWLQPLVHGLVGFGGPENIHDLNMQPALYPTQWITTQVQYHIFRLDEAKDALYGASGVPLRIDPTGKAGTNVGQEIDLLTNFHLSKHTDFLLGYSHLFAGDFIKQTGNGRDVDYLYAQWSFRW